MRIGIECPLHALIEKIILVRAYDVLGVNFSTSCFQFFSMGILLSCELDQIHSSLLR
jgi:hypothetical protein